MNIKETFLYKDILSKNLGSEFNANLEWELERVKDSGIDFSHRRKLKEAFTWKKSPQEYYFWRCVDNGFLPEEYL